MKVKYVVTSGMTRWGGADLTEQLELRLKEWKNPLYR